MEDTADYSAISGLGDAADYDAITGGVLAYNQDPYSAAGSGTLNSSNGGTGTAPAVSSNPAPSNGSSYTPPGWLSSLVSVGSGVAGTALDNFVSNPLINGKPATSPAAAGQKPAAGSSTITLGGSSFSLTTILLIVGAVLAFFFFRKK